MTGALGFFGIVAVVLFAGVADALPPKKIVGGTRAAPGEFPYMVSLQEAGEHVCGGAIVGPRHIVTAAHCINEIKPQKYSDYYVATGSVFINGGTNRVFSKLIPHPDFNFGLSNREHDIGIIVLSADIAFDENQTSIDLPTDLVPEGVFANITGWGYTDLQTMETASELMKIHVKTVGTDACRNLYAKKTKIQSTQLCTFGGIGVGTCALDSGGPLAYNGQLIGVLSYGMPCAREFPDVFTSVYHHLDWIQKTMEE